MNYFSSVLCLVLFLQLLGHNIGEPLFGNENVHIKVHVPEEISHKVHETIIYEPANKITHYHRHQHEHRKYPQKLTRTQIRHNQYDNLLEDILLADFQTTTHFEKTNDDIYEPLNQHTENYSRDYDKATYKKPVKYINTYKVIEYKEPVKSKNLYPPQHQYKRQHKSKTHNVLNQFIESKYLPPTGGGDVLYNLPDSTDFYHYPVKTQTKSTNPHKNSMKYQEVNDYYKPALDIKPPYYSHNADLSPQDDFELSTNINLLPAYDIPALSADHTDTETYDLLTPNETLTLPIKEASDFHSPLQSHAFNNGDFKPFIGEMYLPVGEYSSITHEAAETYTGIDSYSASHVQGLDYISNPPYRRWSSFI
ncbi:PREDICTED: uncharacterized protein LOC108970980 [Bactrocera latifrons]|uniref:uncharacterized protein LOC108970980 n=1 Tax=Bactrocera latifrons TaxID=174628 RepID=UPI0008DE81DF|nr:PREDICTED: uncharacterized protein LOC108970980 [Bactrocera latifrons]